MSHEQNESPFDHKCSKSANLLHWNMVLSLQTLVEQLPQDDPDYDVDLGCLLYKEGEYEEACKKFMSSMNVLGYQPGERFITGACLWFTQNLKRTKQTNTGVSQ